MTNESDGDDQNEDEDGTAAYDGDHDDEVECRHPSVVAVGRRRRVTAATGSQQLADSFRVNFLIPGLGMKVMLSLA